MTRHRILVPVLAIAAFALACGSGGVGGRLSVSARAADPAAASGSALELGNGVSIDRVRVAVKELELEGGNCAPAEPAPMASGSVAPASGASTMSDGGSDDGDHEGHGGEGNDDGDDDECEFETGPFGIDLSGDQLVAPVTHVFDGEVPPGTYEELEVKVCPVHPEAGDFFAEMNGASVVIDGSVTTGEGDAATTTPFSLAFPLCVEMEREMTIVVEPEGASANVTISFDPSAWFVAGDGSALDPTNPDHLAAIAANVRASFDAFEDEDHDGHRDDE